MDIKDLTFLKMQKVSFVVIVACLAAIFVSGFDVIMAKSRDTKRRVDIKIISKALNLYYDKYGIFPEGEDEWQGWDLSYNFDNFGPDFLDILSKEGFLEGNSFDPLNNADYHYRYQKYPAGSYGCKKPFYILQVSSFELLTEDVGFGSCPEINWPEFATNGYSLLEFEF